MDTKLKYFLKADEFVDKTPSLRDKPHFKLIRSKEMMEHVQRIFGFSIDKFKTIFNEKAPDPEGENAQSYLDLLVELQRLANGSDPFVEYTVVNNPTLVLQNLEFQNPEKNDILLSNRQTFLIFVRALIIKFPHLIPQFVEQYQQFVNASTRVVPEKIVQDDEPENKAEQIIENQAEQDPQVKAVPDKQVEDRNFQEEQPLLLAKEDEAPQQEQNEQQDTKQQETQQQPPGEPELLEKQEIKVEANQPEADEGPSLAIAQPRAQLAPRAQAIRQPAQDPDQIALNRAPDQDQLQGGDVGGDEAQSVKLQEAVGMDRPGTEEAVTLQSVDELTELHSEYMRTTFRLGMMQLTAYDSLNYGLDIWGELVLNGHATIVKAIDLLEKSDTYKILLSFVQPLSMTTSPTDDVELIDQLSRRILSKFPMIKYSQDLILKAIQLVTKPRDRYQQDKFTQLLQLILFFNTLYLEIKEFDSFRDDEKAKNLPIVGGRIINIPRQLIIHLEVNDLSTSSQTLIQSNNAVVEIDCPFPEMLTFSFPIQLKKSSDPKYTFPIPVINRTHKNQLVKLLRQKDQQIIIDIINFNLQDHLGQVVAKFSWSELAIDQISVLGEVIKEVGLKETIDETQTFIANNDLGVFAYDLSPVFEDDTKVLRIRIDGKLYATPQNNYQVRMRNHGYQIIQKNDLSLAEFYPITREDLIDAKIALISKQDYETQYRCVNQIEWFIQQLSLYSGRVNELIRKARDYLDDKDLKQEYIQREINWVFYLKSDKPVYQKELYFMYAYYRLRSKVNDWESSAFTNQRVKLNLQSFTENLVLKVAKMMQGSVKPSKQLTLIQITDFCLQWYLLEYIIRGILDYVDANKYPFKAFSIELNEVGAEKVFTSKTLSQILSGFDLIFRLAPTSYFIYNGVLIIRLHIATIRNDIEPVRNLSTLAGKVRSNKRSQHLFSEQPDLKQYVNSVMNLDNLLKEVFAKRQ